MLTHDSIITPSQLDLDNIVMPLEDFDDIQLFFSSDEFVVPGEFTLPSLVADDTLSTPYSDSGRKTANTSSGKTDKLAAHRARAAKKRQVLRQREKAEGKVLMEQQRELTEELLRLQRAKEIEHTRLVSSRAPSYYLWRTIAMRELNERLEAEAERKHLTCLINTQANYIGALEREARKRSGDSTALEDQVAVACGKKEIRVDPTEDELYNAYLQELQANYEQIDAFFEDIDIAGLLKTEPMIQSVQRRESDGEVEFFQQLSKFVEPFSLLETTSSMWNMSKTQISGRGCQESYIGVTDPENTFTTKFRETIVSKTGEKATFLQRSIGRRFVGADGVVHVWKNIIEGEGKFRGKCLEETGWMRMQQSTDMAKTGTQIEMCIRKVPKHFKTKRHSVDTVGDFHEVLQEVGATTEAEIIASMQKLLVKDTKTTP
ncbi:hypothetical protein PHYBOEH_005947 [Phytophthora boehmeriae]|uniref:M96 mating-specific protein family n=1 Tax=Phytophthora boehmeriae TaxID=109152 RepID=A0A8T1WIT4_9STRA|nr:hypothetical protein PHYBOEH_005947 [Phytophthora boehmeriae]